jgi:hypothetical protein
MGTTCKYSATVILTIYTSLLHTLVSKVYYTLQQSSTGNWFITVSLLLLIKHEVFFAQPNSCLSIVLNHCRLSQVSDATINFRTRRNFNSNCVRSSLYSLGSDPQKTPLTMPLLLLRDVTTFVMHSSAACVQDITQQRLFLCLHSSCLSKRPSIVDSAMLRKVFCERR